MNIVRKLGEGSFFIVVAPSSKYKLSLIHI